MKATLKIKEKIESKAKLDRNRDQNLHEVKKIDQRIQKMNVEIGEISERICQIEKENPWILSEKHMINSPEHPQFNFDSSFNAKSLTIKYYRMKEETEALKKEVNTRVDQMADQADQEYTDLIKKKDKMLVDKKHIEHSIDELDVLRNETLKDTFKHVNINFMNIFATLLPGAMAKIEKVDESDISQGMRIRIGFNDSWKDGLSELSGGQRSLLALSFILALLKFKPAPIYILDEIDAALDLAHT